MKKDDGEREREPVEWCAVEKRKLDLVPLSTRVSVALFLLFLSLSFFACASPLFLAAAAVAADTEASTSAVHPCCLHQWNKSARVPQMLEFSLRVVVVVVLCTEREEKKKKKKKRERERTRECTLVECSPESTPHFSAQFASILLHSSSVELLLQFAAGLFEGAGYGPLCLSCSAQPGHSQQACLITSSLSTFT